MKFDIYSLFLNKLMRILITTIAITCISYSEEYVSNITASINNDSIQINYKLQMINKGYADNKKLSKSRFYTILLYYSIDNGVSFYHALGAYGNIGNKIGEGNKVIIWKPLNNSYGLIGNVIFKIYAEPEIPRMSFGISLKKNIDTINDSNINGFGIGLNIYGLTKNGNLLFPIAIYSLTDKDTKYYETDKWHTHVKKPSEYIEDRDICITIGFGWQTLNRKISYYLSSGIMMSKTIRQYYDYNSDGTSNITYDTSTGSSLLQPLEAGINIKLFDNKKTTVLLPITFLTDINDLNIYLISGIGIQF